MSAKKQPARRTRTSVSNIARMDVNHPIPFDYKGTTFSWLNNTAYIPFLPPKDTYGQLLLEARLLSDTHNACVTTKRDYCAGIGMRDAKGRDLPKNIIEWGRSLNLKNESFTELCKRIFEDFFTWGNVPIEIVRGRAGTKKYIFIYVHSMLEWRLAKPDDDDIVRNAIGSKMFLRTNILTPEDVSKAKNLPIYNPLRSETENWHRDGGVQRTMIWYKNGVSGFPYYGLPSAVSSMIYQFLEYKGARFNLDLFDNNMVASAVLALKGNLSDEEANRIGKKIIDSYTGDGRRGRTIVVSSEEGIDGSDFHNMDTKSEGSYIEADEKWSQKIVLANAWDSILAGIVSPSTLGKGSGFLTKIKEDKLNNVIRPAQNDLMQKVWSQIFKIADEWLGLGLGNFELEIHNNIDISGLTDVDITPAVTINEVRTAKGLPEDKNMNGVYMKAAAPQPGDEKAKDNSNDKTK